MTRKKQSKRRAHKYHEFERVDRKIDDLEYYYFQCKVCYKVQFPVPQLQKLWEYAQEHQFMFIQDWVLALLHAQPMPVIGITSFIKQLFLTLMEFAQEHDMPTENPGFRAYNFGPYSERIEDVINSLEEMGIIETEGRRGTKGEYFRLTEKGRPVAKRSFNKLTTAQQEAFQEERLDWHQMGTNGLMKYIYREYPEYAEESVVLERVLHRRRKGKKVWRD